MVALRGKKAAAKPKKLVADSNKSTRLRERQPKTSQQKKLPTNSASIDDLQSFLRFFLHSSLLLDQIPPELAITTFCNTLITAFSTGKDRKIAPSEILAKLSRTSRKRVCGSIFTSDEIAYSCRNCQTDSTCVTCRECFINSDHSGHDVYFQRTTAGSSCDCGDPHAWKPGGFCSRHPGLDPKERSINVKEKLPKNLSISAQIVIDTVIQHIHEVLLSIDYSFELADAMETFTRDLSNHLLQEIMSENHLESKVLLRNKPSTISISNNQENASDSQSNHKPTESLENQDDESKSNSTAVQPVKFSIRLHNDDVSIFGDVVNQLCNALACSNYEAQEMTNRIDQIGEEIIDHRTLLRCCDVVGNLIRGALNVSVAPVWLTHQMELIQKLLRWLHILSTTSDGLAQIVSESLRKKRALNVVGFDSILLDLKEKYKSSEDFMTALHSNLHVRMEKLVQRTLGEDEMFKWIEKTEKLKQNMFQFRGSFHSTQNKYTSGDLDCSNIFVKSFVEAIISNRLHDLHENVQEAVKQVVSKFYKPSEDLSNVSALDLLIQNDCVLKKSTAEISHSLLREHMLEPSFRISTLESYATSFVKTTKSFLKGLGTSTDRIFDFAVQFLTVPDLVKNYTKEELVKHPERPDVVKQLLYALDMVFRTAVKPLEGDIGRVDVNHPAITNQKYKHCVDNLEYVFNIGGISYELVCNPENLSRWLTCLSLLQGADPQRRRGIEESHVEYESESWLSMFNLGIRLHSIYPVVWNAFKPSVLQTCGVSERSIFELIVEAVLKISSQKSEATVKKDLVYVHDLVKRGKSPSFFSCYDYNVARELTSFHAPVHRFLAAAMRHVAIHQSDFFSENSNHKNLLSMFVVDRLDHDQCLHLIDSPMCSLVMAAQIHSNLWRRNGEENMMAQLYNYSALPYCIHYRDSDIFMLQMGVLMLGPDKILSILVDRFQLGSYFSSICSDQQGSDLENNGGYQALEEGIDSAQMLQLIEELLRLVLVVSTSLPSSSGKQYEEEFLEEEMLQHLCAKSYSFSRLFELAILPSGQDEVSIPRLEQILSKVADFIPPTGLEAGRFELKDGLLAKYNPYFLHLNRESHELARDRWTTFRKERFKKTKGNILLRNQPLEPLTPPPTPLGMFRPITKLLTCESLVSLVTVILWKILQSGISSSTDNNVSDGVVSTCLHMLVYALHTISAGNTSDEAQQFWCLLSRHDLVVEKKSLIHVLRELNKKTDSLLDEEQSESLEWIVWKIKFCSARCRELFSELDDEEKKAKMNHGSSGAAAVGASTKTSLEQRKEEARKRALEAMAKQQAAFQSMMSNMQDDISEEEDANNTTASVGADRENLDATHKRSSSTAGLRDVESKGEINESIGKRQRLVTEEEVREEEVIQHCILCHDTSAQAEMGMVAYVHQSTVLSGCFRPSPHEALGSHGAEIRQRVAELIEKMELISGRSSKDHQAHSSGTENHLRWALDNGNRNVHETVHQLNARVGALTSIDLSDEAVPASPQQDRAGRRFHSRIAGTEIDDEIEALNILEHMLSDEENVRMLPMDRVNIQRAIHDLRHHAHQHRRGNHSDESERDDDEAVNVVERSLRRVDRLQLQQQLRRLANGDGSDSEFEVDEEDGPTFTFSRNGGLERISSEIPKLYLTPCGLHIRTCHHAVHINCLERYINSLHDKAIRGEEFDGVQAIDPDSAMTQFLCPLCKTLCNFLIPTSHPTIDRIEVSKFCLNATNLQNTRIKPKYNWYNLVQEQADLSNWYRIVMGRNNGTTLESARTLDNEVNPEVHDLWRDYFEETLWEPHGSLEKGTPFLWSACSFTLASFLPVLEEEFRTVSGKDQPFNPLLDDCPSSLEKDLSSLSAVTKFSRWSFSLLEHSADAKVIWETAKRCAPIHHETKREYRKFTNIISSIDACLRGTILGLLIADSFTSFVVTSAITSKPSTILQLVGVFSVADLFQKLQEEFFMEKKFTEKSLLQDKYTMLWSVEKNEIQENMDNTIEERRTRSGRSLDSTPTSTNSSRGATRRRSLTRGKNETSSVDGANHAMMTLISLKQKMENDGKQSTDAFVALCLLEKLAQMRDINMEEMEDATLQLQDLPSTSIQFESRMKRIFETNALLFRRMRLFWYCLAGKSANAEQFLKQPSLQEIFNSPDAVLEQIWKWCIDRMTNRNHLAAASKTQDRCEHSEGCSEAYLASMFLLRDMGSTKGINTGSKARLIDLPIQYDELYSQFVGKKCKRCEKVPSDPGICLICGEYLCCGDSCCTILLPHGPSVGECTRHAAECGGGSGVVLMLDQCRVAIIGGSMAAHFPSPYVDAHGEEDIGLQRGRPLRLDMERYRHLESLWVNHRIFAEVSRLRNQKEPHFTINLSYL